MIYNKIKRLMGTDITITVFGSEDLNRNVNKDIDNIFDIFYDLELEFSRFLSDSSLNKLNQNRELKGSDRFLDVMIKSKYIYYNTNGYFNPLINLKQIGYSLDFDSNNFIKEDENKIVNLELNKLKTEGNNIILYEGQTLDLGGIVKGLGVDLAKEYLNKIGYKNYIVDAGGDIYTSGFNQNGGKIVVGIDNPFAQNKILATLELENKAIATSGNYKRKWNIENQEYNHIINPNDGLNNNEIISISLIADDCYLIDAYATACIAMGKQKTIDFLNSKNIDYIMICADKKIYKTKGMDKYKLEFLI